MDLSTAITQYLVDLKLTNRECTNPNKETGAPCAQCYERERVIWQVERILLENSSVTQKDVDDIYSLYDFARKDAVPQ